MLAGRVGHSLAPDIVAGAAAMLSDYPVEAAATPALLAYVAMADWGCAYTSAGDQRRSRTQPMIRIWALTVPSGSRSIRLR